MVLYQAWFLKNMDTVAKIAIIILFLGMMWMFLFSPTCAPYDYKGNRNLDCQYVVGWKIHLFRLTGFNIGKTLSNICYNKTETGCDGLLCKTIYSLENSCPPGDTQCEPYIANKYRGCFPRL